jgi:hypothetical protein
VQFAWNKIAAALYVKGSIGGDSICSFREPPASAGGSSIIIFDLEM